MKNYNKYETRRCLEGLLMDAKIKRAKEVIKKDKYILWRYGVRDSATSCYIKYKYPRMAKVEEIFDNGFTSYIVTPKGEKVRQYFTYIDVVIRDLVICDV